MVIGILPRKADRTGIRAAPGFTLIELLVVIAIITIIVSISLVSYSSITKRSRDAKRKADIQQMRAALEMYRTDNGSYPNTGSGSWTNADSLATPLVSAYLPEIPADPQSPTQVYRYEATSASGGKYYGYCLSAFLETESPTNSCTPDPAYSQNYGVKNP
ncbi:type II secretion system protein GspG [Patescibacteria group bacterium]|nr:type II secretion system protein GspG [Patescibacteria group bacterium]